MKRYCLILALLASCWFVTAEANLQNALELREKQQELGRPLTAQEELAISWKYLTPEQKANIAENPVQGQSQSVESYEKTIIQQNQQGLDKALNERRAAQAPPEPTPEAQ